MIMQQTPEIPCIFPCYREFCSQRRVRSWLRPPPDSLQLREPFSDSAQNARFAAFFSIGWGRNRYWSACQRL